MDIHQARNNMLKQQIRPYQVFNESILDLFAKTPREQFVPNEYKELAYADFSIPLGGGRYMMPPKEQARILQALSPQLHEKALLIGTDNGYLTALLAKLVNKVISLDVDANIIEQAKRRCYQLEINNVDFKVGDLQSWPKQEAPFDIIIITGALPDAPENLKQALTIGGRLFAFTGKAPVMSATLLTHIPENEWLTDKLFETQRPTLMGVSTPKQFVF